MATRAVATYAPPAGYHTDSLGQSAFWSDLIGPSVRPWDSDGVRRTPAIGDPRNRGGWSIG
jgi:hypothetical protein